MSRKPSGVNAPAARLVPASPQGVLDHAGFADAMAALAGAVCVAAAGDGAERVGRTVTAVASLSPEPPTLLVSVTRDSALARAILSTGGFSLAMLAPGQEEIADLFAGKRGAAERFAEGRWRAWPSGRPLLLGAAQAVDCTLAGVVELPTHCLFVGALVGSLRGGDGALVWHRRAYKSL